MSTRVATVPAVCTASPPGGPAARIASRTPATRVACWVVARPPDWASAASTVSCSARPSADCPASRTATTRATRDSEPASRATNAPSAPESGPAGAGRHHRDRGQRGPLQRGGQLGRLLAGRAGRQERGVIALRHARQRRQQRHGRGRAGRPGQHDGPAEADGQPSGRREEGTHEGHRGRPRRARLPGERKVASWQIRTRYRPAPGEIPESPGVYKFRDQRGRVIYVGKAKSLRQRLNPTSPTSPACTRAPR